MRVSEFTVVVRTLSTDDDGSHMTVENARKVMGAFLTPHRAAWRAQGVTMAQACPLHSVVRMSGETVVKFAVSDAVEVFERDDWEAIRQRQMTHPTATASDWPSSGARALGVAWF